MSPRPLHNTTDFLRDSAIMSWVIPSGDDGPRRLLDLRYLLDLACDWYWALDEDLRLVHFDGRGCEASRNVLLSELGKPPWEWRDVAERSPDYLALHDALDGRRAFSELTCVLRDDRGQLRHLVMSGEPVFEQRSFVGFHGTVRDLTQHMRSEALVALEHEVTRRLAEPATARRVLEAVMQTVCDSEHWDAAGFFRVEDAHGTTRLVCGWSGPGAPPDAFDDYRARAGAVPPGASMLRETIVAAEPRWIAGRAEAGPSPVRRIDGTRRHATFLAPVLFNEAVIGVLGFASREAREPDEQLLRTMRVIGRQVGQFLKHKEAEQVLRESEQRFRALTNLSSDWYWEKGADLRLTRIEGRAVGDVDALTRARAIGQRFSDVGLDFEAGEQGPYQAKLDARLPFRDVVLTQTRDGRRRWMSISGEPIFDRGGTFAGYRGIGRDITERRETELRIRHMATHDALTGLPNRAMVCELLAAAVRSSERTGRPMAVLFVDLDGFKGVNDRFGHEAGDRVLKEGAERLAGCLRGADVVGRLGGDEFVVIAQGVDGVDDATEIARKVIAAIAVPFACGDEVACVTASIGICLRDHCMGQRRGRRRGRRRTRADAQRRPRHVRRQAPGQGRLRRPSTRRVIGRGALRLPRCPAGTRPRAVGANARAGWNPR